MSSKGIIADNGGTYFEVRAKGGLTVKINKDKIHTIERENDREIPFEKVEEILLKQSTLDKLRFETTVIMNLTCGRIITLKRIPSSKATKLKETILAAL